MERVSGERGRGGTRAEHLGVRSGSENPLDLSLALGRALGSDGSVDGDGEGSRTRTPSLLVAAWQRANI